MKFWEAMRYLEEGKKVRKVGWNEKDYICLNENEIVDEDGDLYSSVSICEEWELYEEVEENSASEFKKLAQALQSEEIKKEEMLKEEMLKEIKPKIDRILKEAKEVAIKGEYQYEAFVIVYSLYSFTLMNEYFEGKGFKVNVQGKETIEYFDPINRHNLFNGMDYCFKYHFILSWE
jgi:hypothetical protein